MKETTSFLQCHLMPIATKSLDPGLLAGNEKNPRPDVILKSNLTLICLSPLTYLVFKAITDILTNCNILK